jgi:glycosyltransferase involved in cell wall biosynthesis
VTGIAERQADTPDAAPGVARERIAIFTSHPIQYQAPLFRALAARHDLEPTVYFGSRHGLDVSLDGGFGQAFRWDVPLVEGYAHAFLPNVAAHPDVSRFRGVRVTAAAECLASGGYAALLLLGWQTFAHLQMLRAAWTLGIPVIVRGESTLQRTAVQGMSGVVRRAAWLPIRHRLYRAAFDRVDAFLVIGSRNRDYYRSFGVPDEKLVWPPYGVDNDWFALSEAARASARERVRARIHVTPGTVVCASSAKLIARKRPFDLIDAVARARSHGREVHALFIGDGEARGAILSRATDAGISGAVTVSGFVNQRELPDWYAASDVLVLPSDSRETWGLVVNEAMAAGLPVVVSDAAGCSVDLVHDGENGFTYPCGDVRALADRLTAIASIDDAGRRSLGLRSREIVKDFGVDVVARAVASTVARVSGRSAHG